MYAGEIHDMSRSCVPAPAEFEPLGKGRGATVDGPVGGNP
jgi:hypothetical protein